MFRVDHDIKRHAAEFLRALNNHDYEVSPAGLRFPKQRVFIGGHFETMINGNDLMVSPNLIPTEGLNHVLNSVLNGATQVTAWYMALYTNNVSPQASTDADNFTATMTEFTSYTGNRQLCVFPDSTAGSIDNDASRAEFPITGSATLRGGAIISVATKSSQSGVMFACTAFDTARAVIDGDNFQGLYACTAQNEP